MKHNKYLIAACISIFCTVSSPAWSTTIKTDTTNYNPVNTVAGNPSLKALMIKNHQYLTKYHAQLLNEKFIATHDLASKYTVPISFCLKQGSGCIAGLNLARDNDNFNINDNFIHGSTDSNIYMKAQVSVASNGITITATHLKHPLKGKNYASGMMNTKPDQVHTESFAGQSKWQAHGGVLFRAKVPSGGCKGDNNVECNWPGLWLLSKAFYDGYDGNPKDARPWPTTAEIDVLENGVPDDHAADTREADQGGYGAGLHGADLIWVPAKSGQKAHYTPGPVVSAGHQGLVSTTQAINLGDKFHTYEVVWDIGDWESHPTASIQFYYDGLAFGPALTYDSTSTDKKEKAKAPLWNALQRGIKAGMVPIINNALGGQMGIPPVGKIKDQILLVSDLRIFTLTRHPGPTPPTPVTPIPGPPGPTPVTPIPPGPPASFLPIRSGAIQASLTPISGQSKQHARLEIVTNGPYASNAILTGFNQETVPYKVLSEDAISLSNKHIPSNTPMLVYYLQFKQNSISGDLYTHKIKISFANYPLTNNGASARLEVASTQYHSNQSISYVMHLTVTSPLGFNQFKIYDSTCKDEIPLKLIEVEGNGDYVFTNELKDFDYDKVKYCIKFKHHADIKLTHTFN